jgi:hypothetical protein
LQECSGVGEEEVGVDIGKLQGSRSGHRGF